MKTTQILIAVCAVVVLIGGYMFMTPGKSTEMPAPVEPSVATETEKSPSTPESPAVATETAQVKEFAMNSWMETVDGKMSAHFSLKEIVVKKGDKVKITITNTAGTHDFKIDAYNVGVETPLNVPTVVEFTADQVGEFEFYCSKYSHRKIGQTGTLRVTE